MLGSSSVCRSGVVFIMFITGTAIYCTDDTPATLTGGIRSVTAHGHTRIQSFSTKHVNSGLERKELPDVIGRHMDGNNAVILKRVKRYGHAKQANGVKMRKAKKRPKQPVLKLNSARKIMHPILTVKNPWNYQTRVRMLIRGAKPTSHQDKNTLRQSSAGSYRKGKLTRKNNQRVHNEPEPNMSPETGETDEGFSTAVLRLQSPTLPSASDKQTPTTRSVTPIIPADIYLNQWRSSDRADLYPSTMSINRIGSISDLFLEIHESSTLVATPVHVSTPELEEDISHTTNSKPVTTTSHPLTSSEPFTTPAVHTFTMSKPVTTSSNPLISYKSDTTTSHPLTSSESPVTTTSYPLTSFEPLVTTTSHPLTSSKPDMIPLHSLTHSKSDTTSSRPLKTLLSLGDVTRKNSSYGQLKLTDEEKAKQVILVSNMFNKSLSETWKLLIPHPMLSVKRKNKIKRTGVSENNTNADPSWFTLMTSKQEKVKKKKASAYTASDYRPSAIGIGSVGALVLVAIVVGIIILDSNSLYRDARRLKRGIFSLCRPVYKHKLTKTTTDAVGQKWAYVIHNDNV